MVRLDEGNVHLLLALISHLFFFLLHFGLLDHYLLAAFLPLGPQLKDRSPPTSAMEASSAASARPLGPRSLERVEGVRGFLPHIPSLSCLIFWDVYRGRTGHQVFFSDKSVVWHARGNYLT